MGFKQRIKEKLSSSRDESNKAASQVDNSTITTANEFKSAKSQAELTTGATALQPQKITGKRKVSDASSRPRKSESYSRAKSEEPEPQDYLYFGEGGKSQRSSGTLAHTGSHSRSTESKSIQQPQGRTGNGKDDSGFLNAGGSIQQMGYQNLTYGGSLQYNYSGAEPPM
jgi:hypothetical protein